MVFKILNIINSITSMSFILLGFILYSVLFYSGFNDFTFFIDYSSIDIRFIVLFLLAEPHFALTIPLLYGYRKKFASEPTRFLHIPFAIIVFGAILFFYYPSVFSIIFLIANVYHVNRQSQGVTQLQAKITLREANYFGNFLHLFTAACFIIKFNEYSEIWAFALAAILISISSIFNFIQTKNRPSSKFIFSIIQGYLVFLPIAIFDDLLLAFAVGISIHYIQYLFIGSKVCLNGFGIKLMPLVLIIVAYSLLSSSALAGFITTTQLSFIILIPTIMQLLHFYYDSLIWKRSDEEVFAILKRTKI